MKQQRAVEGLEITSDVGHPKKTTNQTGTLDGTKAHLKHDKIV
jgi:hypothetical protein